MSDDFREQYEEDDIDKIKPAVDLGRISVKGSLLILGDDIYQIKNVTGLGFRVLEKEPPFPKERMAMMFGLILIAASVGVFFFIEGAGLWSCLAMIPILTIFSLVIREALEWQRWDPEKSETSLRIYMNSGYVWKTKGEKQFMENVCKAIAIYVYNQDKIGDFEINMENGKVPQYIINQGVAIFGDAKGNEIYNYH